MIIFSNYFVPPTVAFKPQIAYRRVVKKETHSWVLVLRLPFGGRGHCYWDSNKSMGIIFNDTHIQIAYFLLD